MVSHDMFSYRLPDEWKSVVIANGWVARPIHCALLNFRGDWYSLLTIVTTLGGKKSTIEEVLDEFEQNFMALFWTMFYSWGKNVYLTCNVYNRHQQSKFTKLKTVYVSKRHTPFASKRVSKIFVILSYELLFQLAGQLLLQLQVKVQLQSSMLLFKENLYGMLGYVFIRDDIINTTDNNNYSYGDLSVRTFIWMTEIVNK